MIVATARLPITPIFIFWRASYPDCNSDFLRWCSLDLWSVIKTGGQIPWQQFFTKLFAWRVSPTQVSHQVVPEVFLSYDFVSFFCRQSFSTSVLKLVNRTPAFFFFVFWSHFGRSLSASAVNKVLVFLRNNSFQKKKWNRKNHCRTKISFNLKNMKLESQKERTDKFCTVGETIKTMYKGKKSIVSSRFFSGGRFPWKHCFKFCCTFKTCRMKFQFLFLTVCAQSFSSPELLAFVCIWNQSPNKNILQFWLF